MNVTDTVSIALQVIELQLQDNLIINQQHNEKLSDKTKRNKISIPTNDYCTQFSDYLLNITVSRNQLI